MPGGWQESKSAASSAEHTRARSSNAAARKRITNTPTQCAPAVERRGQPGQLLLPHVPADRLVHLQAARRLVQLSAEGAGVEAVCDEKVLQLFVVWGWFGGWSGVVWGWVRGGVGVVDKNCAYVAACSTTSSQRSLACTQHVMQTTDKPPPPTRPRRPPHLPHAVDVQHRHEAVVRQDLALRGQGDDGQLLQLELLLVAEGGEAGLVLCVCVCVGGGGGGGRDWGGLASHESELPAPSCSPSTHKARRTFVLGPRSVAEELQQDDVGSVLALAQLWGWMRGKAAVLKRLQ